MQVSQHTTKKRIITGTVNAAHTHALRSKFVAQITSGIPNTESASAKNLCNAPSDIDGIPILANVMTALFWIMPKPLCLATIILLVRMFEHPCSQSTSIPRPASQFDVKCCQCIDCKVNTKWNSTTCSCECS